MAVEKIYYIKVQGELVKVPKEIYLDYYRMDRRARWIEEKDKLHGTGYFNELDTEEMLGIEAIPDHAEPVEEMVDTRMINEKLHRCIGELSPQERELIAAIYFEGLSERQYSKRAGIAYMTVHDRKVKALGKLKKLLKI